jgi:hypothetical protein
MWLKAGRWAVLGLTVFLVFGMAQVVLAPDATALLYPGSTGDPVNGSINASQDITFAQYIHFGSDHYFRIDLRGEPDANTGKVGFWIDSRPFQGALYPHSEVPFPLAGIDLIVNTEYGAGTPKLRDWTGSSFTDRTDGGLLFERTGSILEWKINDKYLNGPFYWWAATLGSGGQSFNVTSPIGVATPIPSAAWLFASGVIALIGLRRREAGKIH